MRLKVDAISDLGLVRDNNEDMILIQGELIRSARANFEIDHSQAKRSIFAVADGMGGYDGGEFASELVAQDLDDFVSSLPDGLNSDELQKLLNDWLLQIHDSILQKGIEWDGFSGMGTTLVGILFYENIILTMNVGDSRIYRFRDGILRQITTDHSLRELDHRRKLPSNIIYNAIGGRTENIFMDIEDISNSVFTDDQFIICSDGLSDMMSQEDMETLLEEGVDTSSFVKAALEGGGRDNISIINLRIL